MRLMEGMLGETDRIEGHVKDGIERQWKLPKIYEGDPNEVPK